MALRQLQAQWLSYAPNRLSCCLRALRPAPTIHLPREPLPALTVYLPSKTHRSGATDLRFRIPPASGGFISWRLRADTRHLMTTLQTSARAASPILETLT